MEFDFSELGSSALLRLLGIRLGRLSVLLVFHPGNVDVCEQDHVGRNRCRDSGKC